MKHLLRHTLHRRYNYLSCLEKKPSVHATPYCLCAQPGAVGNKVSCICYGNEFFDMTELLGSLRYFFLTLGIHSWHAYQPGLSGACGNDLVITSQRWRQRQPEVSAPYATGIGYSDYTIVERRRQDSSLPNNTAEKKDSTRDFFCLHSGAHPPLARGHADESVSCAAGV